MLERIARELEKARASGTNLSHKDLGKEFGVPPSTIKKEVRYIRELNNTLGADPYKYFDDYCKDINPILVRKKIKLLPEGLQNKVLCIYAYWRQEYILREGDL